MVDGIERFSEVHIKNVRLDIFVKTLSNNVED